MVVVDPEVTRDVRHVACIGLMGSGKSTVGRLVAERLGWGFVDVDEMIETSTGCTVAELWEHGGEDAYRPLEQEIVVDVLGAFDHSVLATPGGVVLDREAVEAIESGEVVAVYLRAGPEVLAERIAHDGGHSRPLIDDHPGEVMRAMFDARDRTYQDLADRVVEVDEMTPDQAASAVLHALVGEARTRDLGRGRLLQGRVLAGQDRQHERPWRVDRERREDAVGPTRDHDALALGHALDGGLGHIARGHPHDLRERVPGLEVTEPRRRGEASLHRTGAQRGGRHAGALELLGHGLGVGEDEGLRAAVRGLPGQRLERGGGRDVEHRTGPALHHAGHERAAQVHDRLHIGAHHGHLAGRLAPVHRSHRREPRVVHEDVDAEAARCHLRHERLARRLVREVRRHHLRAHAVRGGQLVRELAERPLPPRDQRDAVPPLGQEAGELDADAGGGAGHERGAVRSRGGERHARIVGQAGRMGPSVARRLWLAGEHVHALTYFAQEAFDAWATAGIHGFWRGYFATRAAPFGAVGPAIVTATFFGFDPAMVERAIPAVWAMASPEEALAARLAGMDGALRAVLGDAAVDAPEVATTAGEVRAAVDASPRVGRALFAANAGLAWPDPPHLALWHGLTCLREHRGDGHVASWVAAGVDGCQAHVLAGAAGGSPRDVIQPTRGWSDERWDGAVDELRARGLLDGDSAITDAGRRLHAEVEARTDELAEVPWLALGPERTERVEAALLPWARAVQASALIRQPNPMGLPPLP